MTFTQSAGLRDREYAKFESVQPGSLVAVNIHDPIKKYTFDSSDLTADAKSGLVSTCSDFKLNGEIKRVFVDIGDWDATGSLWLTESGTGIPIIAMISGTKAFGSKEPIYPGAYPSTTGSGTLVYTAVGIGSPNTILPAIITEKVLLVASGLGVGNSGLSISIDYK